MRNYSLSFPSVYLIATVVPADLSPQLHHYDASSGMSVAAPTLELATDIDELPHYGVGSCADLVCTVSCAVFSLLEDVPS